MITGLKSEIYLNCEAMEALFIIIVIAFIGIIVSKNITTKSFSFFLLITNTNFFP